MGKSHDANRKPLYFEGWKIDHCQHEGIHADS
jgi:hypothetical protein